MTKLKLGKIEDEKPVRITVELPAQLHRDLVAYAEILGSINQTSIDPARLIAPMLNRFMSADRNFRKQQRTLRDRAKGAAPDSTDA